MNIAEKLTQIAENEPKVYEAGKKAEYDRFWDVYQNSGNIKQYHYAFAGYGWTDETFKPKHNIIMQGSCLAAFQYCTVTDIAERLKECGVVLDTSKCSNFQGMFAYATTKSLPVINVLNCAGLTTTFLSCKALERIEKLVVKKSNTYGTSFGGCIALKDIVIDGEIGNNIDFQDSPLSKASIESVINHLSDTATGKTLTLSKAAVENAFRMTEVNILGSPFDGGTHQDAGVTFTDNGDGTITVSGTSVGDAFYTLKSNISVPKGTYTLHKPTNGTFWVDLSDGRVLDYQTPTFVVDEDGITARIVLMYCGEGTTKITPKIMMEGEWDTLAATKPNWTISLV